MRSIKLVGCKSYTYFPRKMLFHENKVNMVEDSIAETLLADTTEQGMPYFIEIAAEQPATKAANKPKTPKKKAPARKAAKPEPIADEDLDSVIGVPDPELDDDSTEGAVSL